MITRHDCVKLPARCAQENCVRREWPAHVHSIQPVTRFDSRSDLRCFLDSEQSTLRAMRVQGGDGNARLLNSPTSQFAVRQFDDANNPIALDQLNRFGERYMS